MNSDFGSMSDGRAINSLDCDGVDMGIDRFYVAYQGFKVRYVIGVAIIDSVRL